MSSGSFPRLAFCAALAACAGRLAADELVRPARGETVEPGASVVVRWTLDSAIVERGDEMELLLSLDGGNRFPLRVTARIDPRERAWTWRVPALPTEHARLALRVGRGERAGAEEVVLVGSQFSIAGSGALFPEDLVFQRGEWRTREAVAGTAAPARPADCGSPPEVGALHASQTDGVKSTSPLLAPPRPSGFRRASSNRSASPFFFPAFFRAPVDLPLRE
jgi:hypothetical protein